MSLTDCYEASFTIRSFEGPRRSTEGKGSLRFSRPLGSSLDRTTCVQKGPLLETTRLLILSAKKIPTTFRFIYSYIIYVCDQFDLITHVVLMLAG